MGHKHSRDQILGAAYAEALEHGVGRLTFGSVARRVGTSDRVVVYYFPSKDDLVTQVLLVAGAELQALLDGSVAAAADHRALVRTVWPLVACPEADPVMRLYFEAIGLATSGAEPYASLAPTLIDAWITWMADRLDGDEDRRTAEAQAGVGVIDGLLLLRHLSGPQVADRAAARVWSNGVS